MLREKDTLMSAEVSSMKAAYVSVNIYRIVNNILEMKGGTEVIPLWQNLIFSIGDLEALLCRISAMLFLNIPVSRRVFVYQIW